MTMLGEVVLKFGATGEAGEPSLRFKTGHINLLVGPNNAGKSLMLREISGVNPREERHTYYRVQYPPTRIVASVDWSEEVAQSIKQNIVEAAFEAEEQVRAEIERQPWDSLVPKLDQAIKQLTNVREELSSKVFELLKNNSDELVRLINLIPIDKKDGGRLLIAGAVFVLTLARAAVGSSTEKGADTMLAGQQEGSKSLLSPEQTAALENVLEANWRDCCEIFASLGVDMAGLTIKDLCGAKSIAIWLKKASKIPLTGPILLQDPKIAQLPEPDVETIRRFDRFMILGGWLLDTTPLERLLKGLEDVYARLTWADPEHRADIAKDVLYLDGLARLEMTRSVPLRGFDEHDQDAPPILSLLKKPDVMRRLRTMVASALGRHLVIDMVTEAPKVIWRLADKEPDEGLENRYSKAANEYHSRGALLEERSDGIHAFIGMLAAILAKGSDV
ncbi:MAG: hypothetical protein L6Q76_35435, partial [Polyangiaceae bacterium]|nr:hypothetical protein [Polyangiaceae bacterium]